MGFEGPGVAVEEAEEKGWGGGVVDAVGCGGLEGHLYQCQGLRVGWRLVWFDLRAPMWTIFVVWVASR